MSLRDGLIVAAVTATVTAFLTIGGAAFKYYSYDKPALEIAQKAALDAEAAQQRADKRVADQEKKIAAYQKQVDELKQKYELIKNQFISRVTDAIKDGVGKLPKGEPNKPLPPISPDILTKMIIPAAQIILDERDKARTSILQVRGQVDGNFDSVYNALDSDIDALKDAIRVSPPNQRTIRDLLQKIADKWPTTLDLFEQKILNTLEQMGCPTPQLAALP
jgi:hypothetical protein